MKKPIYLAGCIIKDDAGKMLLLHRNISSRQQWEIPGGKIEPDETADEAAAREVEEELGIKVTIQKLLGSQAFTDNDTTFHYSWYSATITSGKPTVMEPELFDEVRYFSLDYLQNHQKSLSVNVQNFLAMLDQETKPE